MVRIKNENSGLIKRTLLVNTAIVIEKAVFFSVSIIIARYLDIHDFGEYATSLGYATLFSSFVDIGINQALIRNINLDSANAGSSFTNGIILGTLLSVLMYSAMIASLQFSGFNTSVAELTMIFGIVRIISEMFKTIYAVSDARGEFGIYIFSTLLYTFLLLASTFLIIFLHGNKFDFALYRLVTTSLVMALLLFYSGSEFDRNTSLKKFVSFTLQTVSFAIYSISMNLIQRLNIIIVAILCGTTAAGVFNNSYLFFATILFIPGSLNRVLVPFLYKIDMQKSFRRYQSVFDTFSKLSLILSYYLLIIFLIFAEEIITIIFGAKYITAGSSLKILSFGIPPMFNIASVVITAIDRQNVNSAIIFAITVLNIPLNIFLISRFGIDGAAVAAVIVFFMIYIISHLYLYYTGLIGLNSTIKFNVTILIITVICLLVFRFLLSGLHFIHAIAAVSICYLIPVIGILYLTSELSRFKNRVVSGCNRLIGSKSGSFRSIDTQSSGSGSSAG